mmetsp:Transcript_94090/g.271957  ORF Transcript_94090/g.271957 Transcript_94090/m.271957 type:complete len:521 (-) Transcript_94090:182-1744(-)
MFMRLQLTSPEFRKEKEDMSFGCPQMQIAHIECAKDKYELLSETVMPSINDAVQVLQNSSVLNVYDTRTLAPRQAFLVPRTIVLESVLLDPNGIKFKCHGAPEVHFKPFLDSRKIINVLELQFFSYRMAVPNFQLLLTGDLAFLCLALGLVDSSGHWCCLCTKHTNFGFDEAEINSNLRSVDKILESLQDWAYLHVLDLNNDELTVIQTRMRNAEEELKSALSAFNAMPELNPGVQGHNAREAAKIRLTNARKERSEANKQYVGTLRKKVKRIPNGFHSKYEKILAEFGIHREAFHGGKLNGVKSIRLTNASEPIMDEVIALLKAQKRQEVTDDEIEATFKKYCSLLGNQEALWSAVRGLEGLLPTQDHVEKLRRIAAHGKMVWQELGLSVQQPKWHLTFDWHLLHVVQRFGGLADKTDEYIEAGHQYWHRWYARYCRVANFKMRELYIRSQERKSRHPSIVKLVGDIKDGRKRKHSPQSSRAIRADENEEAKRSAKRVKRESEMYSGSIPVDNDQNGNG